MRRGDETSEAARGRVAAPSGGTDGAAGGVSRRVRKAMDGAAVEAGAAPVGAKRRLRDLRVTHISLVRRGANGRAIVAKSGDDAGGEGVAVRLVKADVARRLVFGVVYAPGEVDSDGDTMTADEIEAAAHGFLARGATGRVDRDHDEGESRGYVAESWIVRGDGSGGGVAGGDVSGEPAGTWAVAIKVTDAATWADVVSGRIGGLSLMGEARVEDVGGGTTDPSTLRLGSAQAGSGQADGRRTTTGKTGALEGAGVTMENGTMNAADTDAAAVEATTLLDRVRKALGMPVAAPGAAPSAPSGHLPHHVVGEDEGAAGAADDGGDAGSDDGTATGDDGGVGVAVAKDYAARRVAAQIQANTWTLGDALREALEGGEGADDVLASIDQYRAEVAGLLGVEDEAKGRKPKNVYRMGGVEKASPLRPDGHLPHGVGEDAGTAGGDDGRDTALETLAKSVGDLAARVDALAAATPGRQSAETRGDEALVSKGKGFRGVRFV